VPTAARIHWTQTRRLTAALLLVWFLTSFVLTYFARELRFAVLGWPVSFYMAAQGSLLVYLLIVLVYAQRQNARDRACAAALAAAAAPEASTGATPA